MKKIPFPIITLFLSLLPVLNCNSKKEQLYLTPNPVIPTPLQMEYQHMETIGFVHFTVNTFSDKEWGYGDENPEVFNPTQLDAEQWAITAKSAGLKELILTAKHHDGFCLWPSAYTEHSVKNSPYKNGKGDIVLEFVTACRKHGLKVGLYLSPWDRNHKDYGKPEYITYYRNQLRELLTQYGEINEIWFDGANGGDGYYGGANETRTIDGKTYYDWENTFKLVKELQPNILIFSDAGPDIHWIGNEKGYAGTTFWSSINKDSLVIGHSDTNYLNTGDPNGKQWMIGQCDVSIRPGWFYHVSEDSLVKSPQELVDLYYKSVGRNAVLLLNLPPDKRGIIHENDVIALKDFKQIIDSTFANDLAKGAKATANSIRFDDQKFSPEMVLDASDETFWATDDAFLPSELTIDFGKDTYFDRILIQEPVQLGQRIGKFQIEVLNENGWQPVFEGTTIGYKRILRINPVHASKMRLKITDANNTVAISKVGVYKASEKEANNF
jgi:alpha-L-fucosidase